MHARARAGSGAESLFPECCRLLAHIVARASARLLAEPVVAAVKIKQGADGSNERATDVGLLLQRQEAERSWLAARRQAQARAEFTQLCLQRRSPC